MRILFSLVFIVSYISLYGNTTKELLERTAALMDILYELNDNTMHWPEFEEHRHYIENQCTSLSSQKVAECIALCRIIFNACACAHKITNQTDFDAIQKTLIALEAAVEDKQVVRAASLPLIDLDSGILSTNGANACSIRGALLITGTTTIQTDITVIGKTALSTLTTTTATINALTVNNDAVFNGSVMLPGKNTALYALGSYPDAQLRVVAGVVDTDTLALSGGGFTATKNSKGSVTIRFSKPFATTPVVTATAMNSLNAVYLESTSPEAVTIKKINDSIINFIAIGQ